MTEQTSRDQSLVFPAIGTTGTDLKTMFCDSHSAKNVSHSATVFLCVRIVISLSWARSALTMHTTADNCLPETCFASSWGGGVTMATYDAWESAKADFKSLSFRSWKPLLDTLGLIDVNSFSLFTISSMACWETKDANWGDSDRKITSGDRLASSEGCCWRYSVTKQSVMNNEPEHFIDKLTATRGSRKRGEKILMISNLPVGSIDERSISQLPPVTLVALILDSCHTSRCLLNRARCHILLAYLHSFSDKAPLYGWHSQN